MYNRKKRLFLTAVCLSLGLLTGCNVGNTKNYKKVKKKLQEAGFKKVKVIYKKDLITGWIKKENKDSS